MNFRIFFDVIKLAGYAKNENNKINLKEIAVIIELLLYLYK